MKRDKMSRGFMGPPFTFGRAGKDERIKGSQRFTEYGSISIIILTPKIFGGNKEENGRSIRRKRRERRGMTPPQFMKIWPVLKKQVGTLHLPWLDEMTATERDPFRVLISCILSLRTKDRVTGEASKRLFRLADTPGALSTLPVKKIEKAIYPVGFYRVKAKRIRDLSREIVQKYNGAVPNTLEELLLLKGVGRKTANLVVTLGFDKEGICVDTHVHRITNRWGLVKTKTPQQTEFALRAGLPVRYWKVLNSQLVAFGQGICRPISPLCSQCHIRISCPRIGVVHSR